MKEKTLHDWWKSKNIDFRTAPFFENDLQVIDFGIYNTHENGPDFFDAKVRMGTITWCGTVEIHVCSSDWDKHGHQFDSAYNNVILHVVLKKDKEVYNSRGEKILTIEIQPFNLNDRLPESQIPCAGLIHGCSRLSVISEMEHSLLNRLDRKTSAIHSRQHIYHLDPEAVFGILLFRSFGNKINQWYFEQLFIAAYPFLNRSRGHETVLIFGLSGLEMPADITEEWNYLKLKFQIVQTTEIQWKSKGFFSGSSPKKRIIQLITMYQYLKELDWLWLRAEDWITIKKMIVKTKILSGNQFDLILINAIALFYWWYAEYSGNTEFKHKATDLLLSLPPEKNAITRYWENLGINSQNAFDSQALLELKNQKCTFTKCLECKIGQQFYEHNERITKPGS